MPSSSATSKSSPTFLAIRSFTFNDIGLLNNDRITNDNTIAIDGLKEGETWQYSTDGGATFASSTGKSFTLDDGTYVADTIQIKKFDVAGNLLDIAKINETSDIIIDTEKSVFKRYRYLISLYH
jgi:hypothetical protein